MEFHITVLNINSTQSSFFPTTNSIPKRKVHFNHDFVAIRNRPLDLGDLNGTSIDFLNYSLCRQEDYGVRERGTQGVHMGA